MELPFIEIEKTREETDLEEGEELSFEHVRFEKSSGKSNRQLDSLFICMWYKGVYIYMCVCIYVGYHVYKLVK